MTIIIIVNYKLFLKSAVVNSALPTHTPHPRTKRAWYPNVQKKNYYSDVLNTSLTLRVTTAAMRCIDKAGGFDAYIYHTPEAKLNSKLGMALKQRLFAVLQNHPEIEAPRKAKRLPKPPIDTTQAV